MKNGFHALLSVHPILAAVAGAQMERIQYLPAGAAHLHPGRGQVWHCVSGG